MGLFVFWFLFAIVVGVVASSRGRSGVGWWLLAMLISPLLGIILVALLPAVKPAGAAAGPSGGTGAPEGSGAGDEHSVARVKCPECAELVLPEARKCKHCGSALVPRPEQEKRPPEEAAAQAAKPRIAPPDTSRLRHLGPAALAERALGQDKP